MRRIVGYIDGRAQWSDNVPAEPLSVKGWMFGELVKGGPGRNDRAVQAAYQRKSLAKKAERAA